MLSGAESKGKPDCAGLMADADKCSTLRRKKKNLHLSIVCITVTTGFGVLCMGRDQSGVQHQAKNSDKWWEGKGISSYFADMERKQSRVKVWYYPQGYRGRSWVTCLAQNDQKTLLILQV